MMVLRDERLMCISKEWKLWNGSYGKTVCVKNGICLEMRTVLMNIMRKTDKRMCIIDIKRYLKENNSVHPYKENNYILN